MFLKVWLPNCKKLAHSETVNSLWKMLYVHKQTSQMEDYE